MYQCILNLPLWSDWRKVTFTNTLFFSAQSSFIQKFKLDFCDNICRVHTVWAKSKSWEVQNFPRRKFSVSLKKDFIFQVHWYFSASYAFYLQISYIYRKWSIKPPLSNKPPPLKLDLTNKPPWGGYSRGVIRI